MKTKPTKKDWEEVFWKNAIEPNDEFIGAGGRTQWVVIHQLINKLLATQRKEILEGVWGLKKPIKKIVFNHVRELAEKHNQALSDVEKLLKEME